MVAVVCRCGLAGGWLQLVSRTRVSARGSGEVASCEETKVVHRSAGGDSATPRVEMCGGGDEWPGWGSRGGRSVGDASGGCWASGRRRHDGPTMVFVYLL